jgi:hypothetical protein
MPLTFLLHQRNVGLSSTSDNQPGPEPLDPPFIALIAVLSTVVIGAMIFCMYRFWPGRAWRQRRSLDTDQPSIEVKQTFLDLDDAKTLTEKDEPRIQVKQTFLHLDGEGSLSQKKGLCINVHPALRSSKSRSKRKHGSNGNQSLDSTSSISPLIKKADQLPTTPPRPYSPRSYSPRTPPPVPGPSTEVRISPNRTRPLPTPVQPVYCSPEHPSRYDISPLQSSVTLPHRSQLPMSFLIEIDAKREDQTAGRRTVSPLQNPLTPSPERKLSESQLSSRNVSPISAPSTTPVITYPSATPIYLPRPFSKYNPYRPALEPATSKNWPLENMVIPEHTEVRGLGVISPVRKHLAHSPLKAQGTTSPIQATTTTTITAAAATQQPKPLQPEKEITVTHPELDTMFLEDFHRHRRHQQKAKEEFQKQKRKAEREKRKQQAASLKPAKRLPGSAGDRAGKGIPPNPTPSPEAKDKDDVFTNSTSSVGGTGAGGAARSHSRSTSRPGTGQGENPKSKSAPAAENEKQKKKKRGLLPPRLPSKSRKPSQSPDAYERARRISGLHELVGSGS